MGLDKVQSRSMNVSVPQQQTEPKRPPALPTLQEDSKPLNISYLPLTTFSTRTKVEIAAVTLLLAYRASTLAATGTTPAIVAVVSIYLAYKIYQIGLKNILTYFGQNAVALLARALIGPDGKRQDPADKMKMANEGELHDAGAMGQFSIPIGKESVTAMTLLKDTAIVAETLLEGATLVAAPVMLGLTPSKPDPADKMKMANEGVLHDAGAMGQFSIPIGKESVTAMTLLKDTAIVAETLLQGATLVAAPIMLGLTPSKPDPADEMKLAEEGVFYDAGAMGQFSIPIGKESVTAASVLQDGVIIAATTILGEQQTEPEEEEVDNWAASMGGIFFGCIQAVGFLFLM
jgi:hypothetical protein